MGCVILNRHNVGNILQKIGIKKYALRIFDAYVEVKSTCKYILLKKNDVNYVRIHGIPQIYTIDETLDYILRKNISVCRFGDGELNLIDGQSIGFQKVSQQLSLRLRDILASKNDKVLICLPGILAYPNEYTRKTRFFWNKLLVHKRKQWYEYINLSYQYGNADITRCYIGIEDKTTAQTYFQKIRCLWKDKNILLVEGMQSRLGVGNDLFSEAKSIRRILCPAINAFESYEKIIAAVINHADKGDLILVALGPTATVLTFDLSQLGYSALDIGNVDNEYEWYLAGVKKKIKNPLKFSMEVRDGASPEECFDEVYIHQIVEKIGE